MTVMWLQLRQPCDVMPHHAISCSQLWLQPEINMFIFCEAAANHNAGIGVGVVDKLWRHCLLLFLRVLVN